MKILYLVSTLRNCGPVNQLYNIVKNINSDDDKCIIITLSGEPQNSLEKKFSATIPLIAAGGIYTGEDIKKIMKLGASGVQMGTRFVTTNECDASNGFKQAYINAAEKDIEIIMSPVGMPGRAIFSSFIQKVKEGKKTT